MKQEIMNVSNVETVATLDYWLENYREDFRKANRKRKRKKELHLMIQKILGLLLLVVCCYCLFSLGAETVTEKISTYVLFFIGVYATITTKDFLSK